MSGPKIDPKIDPRTGQTPMVARYHGYFAGKITEGGVTRMGGTFSGSARSCASTRPAGPRPTGFSGQTFAPHLCIEKAQPDQWPARVANVLNSATRIAPAGVSRRDANMPSCAEAGRPCPAPPRVPPPSVGALGAIFDPSHIF
jgi:hypothetical protein